MFCCSLLTLSGPGFFGMPGPWGGGEGRGAESARGPYSKTIDGIEMKFGKVVENHKLINLVGFNWQMTLSLPHNDVTTVEILDFYEILPIKIRNV